MEEALIRFQLKGLVMQFEYTDHETVPSDLMAVGL
jgi:hypothetical protein